MNKLNFDFTDAHAVKAGETLRKSLQFLTVDGTAVDLTGWTARMHVRENFDSATPLIELTTENGGLTVEAGTDGRISLYISDEDTSGFLSATDTSPVSYKYDLEVITPSGDVGSPMYGKFKVLPEITK